MTQETVLESNKQICGIIFLFCQQLLHRTFHLPTAQKIKKNSILPTVITYSRSNFSYQISHRCKTAYTKRS